MGYCVTLYLLLFSNIYTKLVRDYISDRKVLILYTFKLLGNIIFAVVDYMSDSEENYYDWNDAELGHYFTWCGNMNPWYFSSRDGVLVVEFQTNDRNTYDQAGVVMEVSSFGEGFLSLYYKYSETLPI